MHKRERERERERERGGGGGGGGGVYYVFKQAMPRPVVKVRSPVAGITSLTILGRYLFSGL